MTSEPSPTRVGRNGTRQRGGLEPEEEHALVELASSSIAPAWRAARKCGSSGIESSDTKA